MTGDELRALGEQYLGERWQTPLARILGINVRTIRRYASGALAIPRKTAHRVFMLCELSECAGKLNADYTFCFDPDGLGYPCYWRTSGQVHYVEVVGVPNSLSPTHLAVLGRLLRKPRDSNATRFNWRDL